MSGTVQTPCLRSFPKTPASTPRAETENLRYVKTVRDWEFETCTSSPNSISENPDCTPDMKYCATSYFNVSSSHEDSTRRSSFSRSEATYTNLADREIRPPRGTSDPTISSLYRSTSRSVNSDPTISPCHKQQSRISRQKLENLPRLRLIILQACKRMYGGSLDHEAQDIQERARIVSIALENAKYDFISFLLASRESLATLVSEGIVSLQLLAIVLERMTDICRLPPLRQDLDDVPSDEKAALMVDRWLRRTADLKNDGTVEVATTMMAHKACRRGSKDHRKRPSLIRASRQRGHTSRQRTMVPVSQNLPITARVQYSSRVDTVHFEVDETTDALNEGEAPTPSRFMHFGESPKSISPKSLSPSTPGSIFEQDPAGGWNGIGPIEVFPAAQAA